MTPPPTTQTFVTERARRGTDPAQTGDEVARLSRLCSQRGGGYGHLRDVRSGRGRRRSGLDHSLQRGEVVLYLALRVAHDEPFGEPEEPARLALERHAELRAAGSRRLQHVLDLKRDRPREGLDRETPRRLVLRHLDGGLDPSSQEPQHLDVRRADGELPRRLSHLDGPRLPFRNIGEIGEKREHLVGRPLDDDRVLRPRHRASYARRSKWPPSYSRSCPPSSSARLPSPSGS